MLLILDYFNLIRKKKFSGQTLEITIYSSKVKQNIKHTKLNLDRKINKKTKHPLLVCNKHKHFIQQTRRERLLIVELNLQIQFQVLLDQALFQQIYLERVTVGLLHLELIPSQRVAIGLDQLQVVSVLDAATVRGYSCGEDLHRYWH